MKLAEVELLSILFLSTCLTVASCEYISQPIENEFITIEKFPSYDWDYEEGKMLAAIAHATAGSNFDKQTAVINCLHKVWETQGHPTITEYFNENYSSTILDQVTDKDYYIVQCVINGTRCLEWSKDND